MELLPWQHTAWQLIARFWQQKRWPHALLLTGPAGSGKREFAQLLAKVLLCEQPLTDFRSCGKCASCKLWQAGNHPDWLLIDGSSEIKIETIRDLLAWGNVTGQQSGRRVVLIANASSMNNAASNALLKFLEEPSLGTMMLLTAERSEQLTLTIASRCQKLGLTLPTPEALRAWLAPQVKEERQLELLINISEGRPYLALRYLDDKLFHARSSFVKALLNSDETKINEALSSEDLPIELLWQIWISVVNDLIKTELKLDHAIINLDFMEDLQQVSQKNIARQLVKFLDRLLEQVKALARRINLNAGLQGGALTVRWCQLLNRRI